MNLKNIKTTGTFLEWVESIRVEVARCLEPRDEKSVFWVLNEYVNFAADNEPAVVGRKIRVCDVLGREASYIWFSEADFERIQTGEISAAGLVRKRLAGTLHDIKQRQKDFAAVIERLSPPKLKKKSEKPAATDKLNANTKRTI